MNILILSPLSYDYVFISLPPKVALEPHYKLVESVGEARKQQCMQIHQFSWNTELRLSISADE